MLHSLRNLIFSYIAISYCRLVDILNNNIEAEEKEIGKGKGKIELMYEWSKYLIFSAVTVSFTLYISQVSKVTLDIICLSAFGYETDSLHNPHNELAEAYEELIRLQTGIERI